MIHPPAWLRNRIMAMKGHDLTLVVEKTIGDGNHSSLSLPSKLSRADFLTELEKAALMLAEMDVVLVEPYPETCRLTLKRWEGINLGHTGSQSTVYVLGSDDRIWNGVVSRNELRKGNTIGVWSFRIGIAESEVCFVVALGDKDEPDQDNISGKVHGLPDISPGYFSGTDWIDSYYGNEDCSD
ncbi:hypothetical protein MLD38_034543 [Melastoma candidum]|uniref:Uncharacterized protein n=1 Tax=Melastoma candidum TaxID=119954 RepID=A0ACB9MCB7_9MYRT|nr:hypothetical protein MLD38_034543 [Melastoma candidum]